MAFRLFLIVMNCLRLFLEGLSQIIFGIMYWNYKTDKLPPIQNLLLIESGTTLALKIRKRKVTSEEVTRAFIDRIKVINPMINSVVDTRFDDAIREAKIVDQYLRDNPEKIDDLETEKPFFGVPITLKECVQVTGLHQTAGIYARKDIVATEDADVVKLLRGAGAIVIAVTNVPEACMWWETSNTIYGRSNNPYDFSRIAGGSSGGEAATLAACGSPMGIGSDIGGSIRMPSYFNGIYGHKASTGIISNQGLEPLAVGLLDTYLSTGPMCRFACDLKPMLKIMSASNASLLSLDKKVNIRNLTIYYMDDDNGNVITTPVNKELKLAIKRATDYFKTTYKMKCEKLKLTQFRRSADIFFGKMAAEPRSNTFCSILVNNNGEVNLGTEIIKWVFGQSHHTFPALLFGVLEKLSTSHQKSKQYVTAQRAFNDLKHTLLEKLSHDAIFLFPPHPTEACYHGQTLFRPFNFLYTSIFNILGLPVTSCPVGLNSNGLPLGIQVIAGPNQDHLCILIAEELEKAFGGWVCPSEIQ